MQSKTNLHHKIFFINTSININKQFIYKPIKFKYLLINLQFYSK